MMAVTLGAALEPYTYDTTVAGGVLKDKNQVVIASSTVTATQAGGPEVAVFNVESFVLEAGAHLFVIGDKPLVIASWDRIEIAGILDAGSTTGELDVTLRVDGSTRIGAGANPAVGCETAFGSPGGNAVSSGGSGGGGGGAFSGNGGRGGIGDTSMQPGGPGGVAVALPSVIRGGCRGGHSGTAGTGVSSPATPLSISVGGNGGGAIELSARVAIVVTGTVTAGGAGGGGAPQGSAAGGGGGGAGGYIGLDAPMVELATASTIAANGGGGGGSAPFAGQGNQGDNAVSAAATAGGAISGGTCGLAGGVGAAGADRNGGMNVLNDSCGGGGGGGAAGYILVRAQTLVASTTQLSPPLQ
jgi:hypothetical protein